ncbi:MAG: DUF2059 domain-containing protein [Firmicutes bacterium]|nr:DUF2059 domain-containing protein [Bacillota bacterium]
MNRWKLAVKALIIGCLFVLVSGGFAQANAGPHTHYQAVEELFVLMKTEDNMALSFAQIRPMLFEQFRQGLPEELAPEQVQIMEEYFGRLMDLMEEELSWPKMKDDFIQIYMSIYTEEEIQELIRFYQTPVGQKTIAQTPVLTQKATEITQKYLTAVLPKVQALGEEMQAEIEAAGAM